VDINCIYFLRLVVLMELLIGKQISFEEYVEIRNRLREYHGR